MTNLIPKIKSSLLSAIVLICVALTANSAPANGTCNMTDKEQSIDAVRAKHDADIMAIDGVVTVATGLDKHGTPCLKIGTSGPPEEIREKLPDAVREICFEVEQVGDIEAQ